MAVTTALFCVQSLILGVALAMAVNGRTLAFALVAACLFVAAATLYVRSEAQRR